MERDNIINGLLDDYVNYLEQLELKELDTIVESGLFTLEEIKKLD